MNDQHLRTLQAYLSFNHIHFCVDSEAICQGPLLATGLDFLNTEVFVKPPVSNQKIM